MKRLTLLCVLLASCASAEAATIATMPNQAGGEIALMDIPCADREGMFVVVGRAGTGATVRGCWVFDEPYVVVKWETDQVSMFHYSQFTLTGKGDRL